MNTEASSAGLGLRPLPVRHPHPVSAAVAQGLAKAALLSVWVLLPLMPVLAALLSHVTGLR